MLPSHLVQAARGALHNSLHIRVLGVLRDAHLLKVLGERVDVIEGLGVGRCVLLRDEDAVGDKPLLRGLQHLQEGSVLDLLGC
jgi:hypothetical protein